MAMTQAERDAEDQRTAQVFKDTFPDKLKTYGQSIENSALTVEGFTEDGTEEHRRNAKEALDFVDELGEDAPTHIPWSSPNHGTQNVTPATLREWLLAAGQRRFKRFTVQASINPADYDTLAELEAAFDAAYEA